MEIFGLVIIGLVVAIVVLPFVAIAKVGGLEKRVAEMARDIWGLRRALDELKAGETEAKPEESGQMAWVETRPETTMPARLTRPTRPTRPVTPKEPPKSVEAVETPKVPEPVETPAVPVVEEPRDPWRAVPESWRAQTDERDQVYSQVPAAPRGRSAGEWEQLIGGNLFNRIGALALLIGLAFLLMYAFEHHQITPWMLIGAGFVCGVGMMVAGERSYRGGAQVFAQGLIGAGVSILYLCVYSSFNFYHLIPQTPALALMCLVTVAAFYQALRVDSLVVGILGLLGGFLTPVLLGGGAGGSGSGSGLLAYMAVLDAGLLTLTLKKDDWAVLEPLALAGTYIVYLGWYLQSYSPADLGVVVGALSVFWGLFHGLDVYRGLRSVDSYASVRMGVGVVNALAYYGCLYAVVDQVYPNAMGLVTLGIGFVYFAGMLVAMRRRTDAMALVPRYSVTAVVLMAVATGIQFRGYSFIKTSLWAVEAFALLWCGVRSGLKYVRGCALALMAIAVLTLVFAENAFDYSPVKAFVPIWNLRFAAFAVVAAACAGIALVLERSDIDGRDMWAKSAHWVWAGMLFLLIGAEVNSYFDRRMVLGLSRVAAALTMGILWAAYSAVLVWLGLRRQTVVLAAAGLIAMVVAALVVATQGAEIASKWFVPVSNLRVLAFVVVIACAYYEQMLISRREEEYGWAGTVAGALRVATVLLGLELISVEWLDYIQWQNLRPGDLFLGVSEQLARLLVLGGAWALYSAAVVWRGYARRCAEYIACGLLALGGATLILTCGGAGYEPLSKFVPVVNLRAAMFVVLAGAMVAHYAMMKRRVGDYDWAVPGVVVMQVAISLLVFELITVETWDALSSGDKIGHLAQMGLSVAWVVYSIVLMSLGIWRRMQAVRFVALALFELSIVKVFLYDMSSLETIYRVFSFIGLGLFLMATSYLYQRYKGVIVDEGGRDS